MIDMNKAKKRLEQLQTTRKDYSKISYSLKQGDQTLRFITKPGEDYPFIAGQIYYKLQKQFFISNEMYDEVDPIMEELNALRDTGLEANVEFAKKLYPSRRIFALAVVREQEDKGAVWVDFPPKIEKELVKYILNPEYGDITDLETGTDFIITKTKGTPWPEYSVTPKRKSSPLMKTPEETAQIFENLPDFKDAYKHYTAEEMKEIWDRYLNTDQNESKDVKEQEVIPEEEEKIDIASALQKFRKKNIK